MLANRMLRCDGRGRHCRWRGESIPAIGQCRGARPLRRASRRRAGTAPASRLGARARPHRGRCATAGAPAAIPSGAVPYGGPADPYTAKSWSQPVDEAPQRGLHAEHTMAMALFCVRNPRLENLHAGIVPVTKTGDHSEGGRHRRRGAAPAVVRGLAFRRRRDARPHAPSRRPPFHVPAVPRRSASAQADAALVAGHPALGRAEDGPGASQPHRVIPIKCVSTRSGRQGSTR